MGEEAAREATTGVMAPCEAAIRLADTIGAMVAGAVTLAPSLNPLLAASGYDDGSAASRARRRAMLGGCFAHCWEIDDIDRSTLVCAGCVVVPAALAALELRSDVTFPELLRAIALGYDAALRAADRAGSARLAAAGWWPTSVFGAIGAATAVAALLRLDATQTAAARNLAAQSAGGVLVGTARGRYLAAGDAAERGLAAALRAAQGWAGPADIFDHPRSPLRRAEDAAGDVIAAGGAATGERVSIKTFAAAKHLQAVLNLVDSVRTDARLDPSSITRIECRLPEQTLATVHRPGPFASPLYAIASAPFTIATALLHGACLPGSYAPERLADPAIAALAGTVDVTASPTLTGRYPGRWGAELAITMRNGTKIRTATDDAPGDPEAALPPDRLEAKFVALTAPVFGSDGARSHWGALTGADADLAAVRRDVIDAVFGAPE